MKRKPLDITIKYVEPSNTCSVDFLRELAGFFAPELYAAVDEIPFALAEARRISWQHMDPAEIARQREIEALERKLAAPKMKHSGLQGD
ncbi:MAG: hypothetical protein ABFD54_14935 [Armatimonadota bacterium]|nr:hypothetical protein [bacterium]